MPLKACQYKHSTNNTKTHYKLHKTHKPNPPHTHPIKGQVTGWFFAGLMLASTINLTTLKKHTPDTHTSMQAQTSIFKRNLEPSTTTPEGAAGAGLMSQSSTVCQPDPTTTNTCVPHPPPKMASSTNGAGNQPDQASSTIPLVNTTNAP